MDDPKPSGYGFRSSRFFIISSMYIALFAETFLFGFIVPILGYMLEDRLNLDSSHTQSLTTALLTIHGFVSLISGPIIAHFADKTPSKKITLLFALTGCLIGTILVACTPSLWALFLGRIIQGVAGSATWVIGLATITDITTKDKMGQVMGTARSFASTGVVGGPMVAGVLLELFGYWPAWSVPMAVLVFDMVARLMIPNQLVSSPKSSSSATEVTPDETTSLLPESSDVDEAPEAGPTVACSENASGRGFYSIMLRDPRVLSSLLNSLTTSVVVAGFDTTLPLHVRNAFGWESLPAGMMFLCLQIPAILLGPVAGSIRDRHGVRSITFSGWVILTPLFVLLGIPGDSRFPWASEEAGKAIYLASLSAIGLFLCLVRGSGGQQMSALVKDLQAKNPLIFGAHGGSSRVSSLYGVSFSLGLMLGPLICGSLVDAAGYFYMNVIMALICLANGASSLFFMEGKFPKNDNNVST